MFFLCLESYQEKKNSVEHGFLHHNYQLPKHFDTCIPNSYSFIGGMVNCQNKENGFLYTFYAGENRKATDTVLSDFWRGMRESSYNATNCDIVTTETTVFVP